MEVIDLSIKGQCVPLKLKIVNEGYWECVLMMLKNGCKWALMKVNGHWWRWMTSNEVRAW